MVAPQRGPREFHPRNRGADETFETQTKNRRKMMGKGILLWLLGVPIPIILLLALVWH
jgi:hypothetical protein